MGKKESLDEEELLTIIKESIKEIEVYTRKIKPKKLNHLIEFVFARLIDNKNTLSLEEEFTQDELIHGVAAYIIVLQILLYLVLSNITNNEEKNYFLFKNKDQIQKNFDFLMLNEVYKPIFDVKIINLLPNESIDSLNLLFNQLSKIKTHDLESDFLGNIFNSLIPFELRKFLAAYYTSNLASKFLANLVIKNPEVNVMDPACGSGTLLISVYKRIKELAKNLKHINILSRIYGVDVSVFATQLARINLTFQDPTTYVKNFNIANMDVFRVVVTSKSNSEKNSSIPLMDILIGNPPFTRGDRLDRYYKDFLESHFKSQDVLVRYNKKYLGLYAYFLLDSLRFLKEKGILAFILPFSTINSISMKPVLKYLLNYYSLKYIISSDAQIAFSEQTVFKEIFFIAQKRRDLNFKAKFVVLKEELTGDNICSLISKIEEIQNNYEDSSIRIRSVTKDELFNTLSIKWNIFLYNQAFLDIFFTIKNSPAISHVNEIVKNPRYDVDRGFRAGITNFFYLPNKYWDIIDDSSYSIKIKNKEKKTILEFNKKYLISLFRKSSLYNNILPNISEYVVIIPPKKNIDNNIKAYIKWGKQKFHKNSGFESLAYINIEKNRKIARIGISHELCLKNGNIMAYYSSKPIFISDNFIFIRTFITENDKILAAYLNSSIFLLTYLVLRREKGGALGQIFGTDMRNFFIINPKMIDLEDKEELLDIFNIFVKRSEYFPSFYKQIKEISFGKKTIRHKLDLCICKILKINNITNFLEELYKILENELRKFL